MVNWSSRGECPLKSFGRPSSPNKFASETESIGGERQAGRQARARNSPDGRSGETRRVFRALRQESLVGSFFVGRSWLLEATGRKIVRCYCGQDVCQTLSSVFYFPSGALLDGAFETNNRGKKETSLNKLPVCISLYIFVLLLIICNFRVSYYFMGFIIVANWDF